MNSDKKFMRQGGNCAIPATGIHFYSIYRINDANFVVGDVLSLPTRQVSISTLALAICQRNPWTS
jgi:hypothetical protein